MGFGAPTSHVKWTNNPVPGMSYFFWELLAQGIPIDLQILQPILSNEVSYSLGLNGKIAFLKIPCSWVTEYGTIRLVWPECFISSDQYSQWWEVLSSLLEDKRNCQPYQSLCYGSNSNEWPRKIHSMAQQWCEHRGEKHHLYTCICLYSGVHTIVKLFKDGKKRKTLILSALPLYITGLH